LRDDEDEKEKTAAADKLEAERRASQDENDRANIARLLKRMRKYRADCRDRIGVRYGD